MIAHFPFVLDGAQQSASRKRPSMMIAAFRGAGYDVDVVSGPVRRRVERFRELRDRILAGETYQFLYSESSSVPALFADPRHVPRYPLADYRFFRFCQRSHIRVGLYYRDVHWRFPHYWRSVGLVHRAMTLPAYLLELLLYRSCVDILFLPSLAMAEHVPLVRGVRKVSLPPGVEGGRTFGRRVAANGELSVLYVGGVGHLYRLDELVAAVRHTGGVRLVICTREGDWSRWGGRYLPLVGDRVRVVHASGEDLKGLYAGADVCAATVKPQRYWGFAVPYKLFEYVAYGKPILATTGTETGRIVAEHGIGWSVPWDRHALAAILARLRDGRHLLQEEAQGIDRFARANVWESRARAVAQALRRGP